MTSPSAPGHDAQRYSRGYWRYAESLSADKAREVFKKAIVRVRIVQDEPGPVSSRLYLRSLQVRNELITSGFAANNIVVELEPRPQTASEAMLDSVQIELPEN